MLKIIIAMCIGIAIGAAVTHELMTPQPVAGSFTPVAIPEHANPQPSAPFPVARAVPAAAPNPARSDARLPSFTADGNVPPRMASAPGGSRTREISAVEASISEAANFADALAQVTNLSGDADAFHTGMRVLAESWLPVSPAQAIAALDSLSVQDSARQAYIESLARSAMLNQPELLGDIFARLRNQREQFGILNGLVQSMDQLDDLEPMLAVATSLPPTIGQSLQSVVYMKLVERDPVSGLARVESLPAGELRQRIVMQSVMQLAQGDPEAAMQWLSSHSGGFDPMMHQSLAMLLGQQAPEIAQQYLPSVPESSRGAWVSAAARGMATRDIDAAINWLDTYRATPYYDDALAGVVQQMASFDPPRAAQLLLDLDPRSTQALNTVSIVANIWAQSDPDSALVWARGLPAGNTRDQALVSLAPALGESMLNDSTLGLFSEQRMRDSAVGAVVTTVARSDRDRAHDLIAAHVSNPAMAEEYAMLIERIGQGNGVVTFGFSRGVGVAPAIGMMPTGTPVFSDMIIANGALPQLAVGPNGVPGRVIRNVVVTESEEEK
jgi:hypothetical protein